MRDKGKIKSYLEIYLQYAARAFAFTQAATNVMNLKRRKSFQKVIIILNLISKVSFHFVIHQELATVLN